MVSNKQVTDVCIFVYTTQAIQVVVRGKEWPAAARLLGLRVRIPPGPWMSVVSVVFSGRGICDGTITRPEESYRLWSA